MMSFRETNLMTVAVRQYLYKLKANQIFNYVLILVQIITVLMSLGATPNMTAGNGYWHISINNYSANIVIIFTCIWIFLVTLTLTKSHYENMDFSLVSNRTSSNLANFGYLLTLSVYGGITASLSGVLLRILLYFSFDKTQIIAAGFYPSPAELMLGIAITVLYLLLIAALGYFIGTFVKFHVLFAIVIPVFFFGLLQVRSGWMQKLTQYFISESSPAIFTGKIIFTSVILFALSSLLSGRMEVKKQ